MTRRIPLSPGSIALATLAALTLAACDVPGRKKTEVVKAPPQKEPEVVQTGGLPPSAPVPIEPVARVMTYDEAETLFKAGKYGDAKEGFERYVGSKPDNPRGHYMLGLSAWKSGDLPR